MFVAILNGFVQFGSSDSAWKVRSEVADKVRGGFDENKDHDRFRKWEMYFLLHLIID